MPKLTKTLVDNAPTPAAGDAWIWDTELEGFGVRIQASGRKTYVIRYRVGRATLWESDMTALRWNATGSSWHVPILRASVAVMTEMATLASLLG